MTRIDRLQIKRFRGITQTLDLEFPAKKKVHVIFGENGTGKTSIIDAIDYITNKNIGSIRDKRGGLISNLPSLNASEPAQIHLTGGEKKWRVIFGKGAPQFSDNDIPATSILRRSNVQGFIEATAGDKFAEIKHLLGIETVEGAERSLNEALKNIRFQISNETRMREASSETLKNYWLENGQPGSDAIIWAESLLQDSTHSIQTYEPGTHRELILVRGGVTELYEIKAGVTEAEARLKDIKAQIQSLPGIDTDEAIALGRLLAEAAKMLSSPSTSESCPVCGQPITLDHLRAEIAIQQKSLHQYSEADTNRRAWQRKIRDTHAQSTKLEQSLLAHLRALAPAALLEDQNHWRTVSTIDAKSKIIKQIDAAIANLQDAESQSILASALRQSIEHTLVSWKSSTDTIHRLKAMQSKLAGIESTIREELHAFSQSILNTVREECNRIYSVIHPREGLGLSELSLDPNARASLVQRGSFAGVDDVSQQAFYSEGHLDTLGFAFWLAHCKIDSLKTPNGSIILQDSIPKEAKSIIATHQCTDERSQFLEIIRNLREMRFIRNQVGAHFNLAGSEIADRQVLALAEIALELVEFITCANCGRVPYKQEGDSRRCLCRAKEHRTFLNPARV